MKKLLILLNILFLVNIIYSQEVLTTGADFLKIPVGGQYSGMGEANSAIVNDVESIMVNVAGLVGIKRLQLFYEHSEWFRSIRFEGFAAGAPLNYFFQKRRVPGYVGLNVRFLYVSPFNIYDDWGEVSEQVKFGSFYFKGGYALSLLKNENFVLSAGGALSIVTKSMASMPKGYLKPSMDIGVLSTIYPHLSGLSKKIIGQSFNVSAVVENIDFYNSGINESLPLSMKMGLGFKIYNMVNFDIDMLKYLDTGFRANIGASYWYRNIVGIRAGGKVGSGQLNHFAWGLGVRQKISGYKAELSYSMLPYSDVGLTHKVSIKVEMPEIKITDKTDLLYYKGVNLFMHNKYELAIEMWEKVLRKDPTHKLAKERIKQAKEVMKQEEETKKLRKVEASFEKMMEKAQEGEKK